MHAAVRVVMLTSPPIVDDVVLADLQSLDAARAAITTDDYKLLSSVYASPNVFAFVLFK